MLLETDDDFKEERSKRGTGKKQLSIKKNANIMQLNFRLSSTAGEHHSTPTVSSGIVSFSAFYTECSKTLV